MTSPIKLRIRRCRAQSAIDAYGQTAGYTPAHDEALIDLLTDLLHWTDGHGLDFRHCLDHAEFHHDAEVQP